MDMPVRKHPASGVVYIEGKPTIIFDTICTKDRLPWLACEEVHRLLREVWLAASAWVVGRYVIMPDHIHLFAAATVTEIEYCNWVTYWKSQFSKRHQNAKHRWQTDDWDTRMRTSQQYEDKWEYVRWNPYRHKLVARPEDWPYQGTLHDVRWD
jgi:putative transposase